MKKMIFCAAALLLCAFSYAQDKSEKSATEQSDWLTSFSEVVISAPMNITFIKVPDSEAPKIVYDTKGSYTSKFKAVVKEKILHITERTESRRTERTEVTVYYNTLQKVNITDAVAMFRQPLDAPLMDMIIGGNAVVTAPLAVQDLSLEISGKSSVNITGTARYLSLYISTAKLDAAGLEVVSAQINASSAAEAALWVTERLVAKTSTGAKITYKGEPSIIRGGSKFFGGDITPVK